MAPRRTPVVSDDDGRVRRGAQNRDRIVEAVVELTARRARGDRDPQLDEKLAMALLSANRAAEARAVVDAGRAAGRPPSAELERRLQASGL
jgi:hypothetical protein